MSEKEAVRLFRVVTRRCALMAAALVCFALSLFPYGDAYAQAHVAFFLFSLLVGGIFCLAHLRSAALVVTLIVVVPFAAFFGATGRPVFIAVAVTVVLVATAMMSMVFAYFEDFANLTQSKKELVARQAETQRLSDENLRLASLDSLTGLPNRRRFFADLDARL